MTADPKQSVDLLPLSATLVFLQLFELTTRHRVSRIEFE
jgi:hypothetical protein